MRSKDIVQLSGTPPRRSRAAIAVLAMVTELSGVGCVDTEGSRAQGPTASTPAARRSEADYCDALCSRFPTCLGFSQSDCVSFCTNDRFVTNLADATLTRVADCYRREPCQAFVDESVYSTCFESMDPAPPTAQCEEFCVLDTEEAYECGGGYSVAACLEEGTCDWSDSILAQAADCTELDCEARVMCQNAVFGVGQ
jgi:hypothetical protein